MDELPAADRIALEIMQIAAELTRQEERGSVDSPGGLEHMGDVWRLFRKWETMIAVEHDPIGARMEFCEEHRTAWRPGQRCQLCPETEHHWDAPTDFNE